MIKLLILYVYYVKKILIIKLIVKLIIKLIVKLII